jgi:hypothetical protein
MGVTSNGKSILEFANKPFRLITAMLQGLVVDSMLRFYGIIKATRLSTMLYNEPFNRHVPDSFPIGIDKLRGSETPPGHLQYPRYCWVDTGEAC